MTITCRVLSTEMLKALTDVHLEKDETDSSGSALNEEGQSRSQSSSDANRSCSLVLAGLHACGDLSVTMLRLVKMFAAIIHLRYLLSSEYSIGPDCCVSP